MIRSRVLVISDAGYIHQVLKKSFEAEGFDVDNAHNETEGFIEAKLHKPVFVIIDDRTDIDCFDICHKFKTQPETEGVFVILLIGKDRKDVLGPCSSARADDWVIKPIVPAHLVNRVMNLFRRDAI